MVTTIPCFSKFCSFSNSTMSEQLRRCLFQEPLLQHRACTSFVYTLISSVQSKVLDGKPPLGEGLSGSLATRVHLHLRVKVGQVTLDGRL